MSKRAILIGAIITAVVLMLVGTVYIFRSRLHYFADQYIEPTNPNLTVNGSFETDITNSWAPTVLPAAANGTIDVTTSNCVTLKCLVMTPKDGNTGLQISQNANISAGHTYLLTAKYKSQTDRGASVSFESASSSISSVGTVYSGTTDWRDIRYVYSVPKDSTATDWKIKIVVTSIAEGDASQPVLFAKASNSPAYLDDVTLKLYDDQPANCINDADARCLDLGASNESGNTLALGPITFNSSPTSFAQDDTVLGAKSSENGQTYREITAGKKVYIHIPSFNVNTQGLPLTPMLLDVSYNVPSPYSATATNLATISSYTGYVSNDAKFTGTNPLSSASLIDLTDSSDGDWRDTQYAFSNGPFPLIHAVNGYFTFEIETLLTKNVRINSLILRTLTADQYARRLQKIQDLTGLTTIPGPTTDTGVATNLDTNPTVFTRDIMDPIYKETKPKTTEIDQPISTFGTLNSVEPMSLGLYSKVGITNISTDISDLKSKDGTDSIAASNVDIRHVVTKPSRLFTNQFSYNLQNVVSSPDYLEEFSALDISADTSERFWYDVHIPSNINGGTYTGNIRILKGGTLLKEVPVSLEILPTILDNSQTIISVYQDPNSRLFAQDQTSVIKYFKDYKISPYFFPTNDDIATLSTPKDPAHQAGDPSYKGTVTGFDTSPFESKLDGLITAGVVKKGKSYVLTTKNQWQDIYSQVFFTTRATNMLQDKNVYTALRDLDFVAALNLYLDKLESIASVRGIHFVYDYAPNPCNNPFLRIVGEALMTQIKAKNLATAISYDQTCDSGLAVPATDYIYPQNNSTVPALSSLIDYKVWKYGPEQDFGFSQHATNYSFDTANYSQLRNPIYNRFALGFYAYSTLTKLITPLAIGNFIKDPLNDFDGSGADLVLGYPNSRTGKFMPTMAAEGLREGIKDSEYLATLDRLIATDPKDAKAVDLTKKLTQLKARISPYLYKGYEVDSDGQYFSMVESVSSSSNANDFTAFTDFRKQIFDAIKSLGVPAIASINITQNQVITSNPYDIAITVSNPGNVSKVEFYVDDVLIGTSSLPDLNGVFSAAWDTGKYHSTVKVVLTDNLGKTSSITRNTTVSLPAGSAGGAADTGSGSTGGSTGSTGDAPAIGLLPKTGESQSLSDKLSAFWLEIKKVLTR